MKTAFPQQLSNLTNYLIWMLIRKNLELLLHKIQDAFRKSKKSLAYLEGEWWHSALTLDFEAKMKSQRPIFLHAAKENQENIKHFMFDIINSDTEQMQNEGFYKDNDLHVKVEVVRSMFDGKMAAIFIRCRRCMLSIMYHHFQSIQGSRLDNTRISNQ